MLDADQTSVVPFVTTHEFRSAVMEGDVNVFNQALKQKVNLEWVPLDLKKVFFSLGFSLICLFFDASMILFRF